MSTDNQSNISEEVLELSIKLADAEARAKASEHMVQALLKTIETIQSNNVSCTLSTTADNHSKTTSYVDKPKNKNEKFPNLRKDIDSFTFKLPKKLEDFIYKFCESKNFDDGLADFIMLVSYYTILTKKSKSGVGISNRIVSNILGGNIRFDWKGNTPLIKFIQQENNTKKYDLTYFMKQQLSEILKELSTVAPDDLEWGIDRKTLIAKSSKQEEEADTEVANSTTE